GCYWRLSSCSCSCGGGRGRSSGRWSRSWCWRRCRSRDRCVHVALDLSGSQCSIVYPYLVNVSLEILPINSVPTDLQGIRGHLDRAGLRATAHLHPIDV